MNSVGGHGRQIGCHHLTIGGYGRPPGRRGDRNTIRASLHELSEALETTKLAKRVLVKMARQSSKETSGLTDFVLIPESQISIGASRCAALPAPMCALAGIIWAENHASRISGTRSSCRPSDTTS
jgi:hypothetical protein